MGDVSECWAEVEHTSRITGMRYTDWKLIGWYRPDREFIKSTRKFDYYQQFDGRYKYRKNSCDE